MTTPTLQAIHRHQTNLRRCTACPDMTGPPVTGNAVASPVLLIGQAPGPKEIETRRPFAWTAGKTLFGWFAQIGLDESHFREHVYMAAVCRCFPGKKPAGGDRVPNPDEVTSCSRWLQTEIRLLKPRLILPVGKLAIAQLMPVDRLNDVVGKKRQLTAYEVTADVIALPHPSGASTWHRTEPGRSLLRKALRIIRNHAAWKEICEQ